MKSIVEGHSLVAVCSIMIVAAPQWRPLVMENMAFSEMPVVSSRAALTDSNMVKAWARKLRPMWFKKIALSSV